MISVTKLKRYVAAYPTAPPRTTALEQKLQIGTGFHNKWYRSQKEHMLGWLIVQECQERRKNLDPNEIDARQMWGRLKCSPLMFWLAEGAWVQTEILDKAEAKAAEAAAIKPKDGDPHGKMMRTILPWELMETAIRNGPDAEPSDITDRAARPAFDRLLQKNSRHRDLKRWLVE